MKKLITSLAIILSVIILAASCSRSLSPYEAANGKAKCRKSL